jgi:DNA-binding transcriptional ArsR family regulator
MWEAPWSLYRVATRKSSSETNAGRMRVPMDTNGEISLNAVFRALNSATRRRMLHEMAHGELTVGEVAAPFRTSAAAASKHIKILERAGLIVRQVRGRAHYCHLDPEPLARLDQWLRALLRDAG